MIRFIVVFLLMSSLAAACSQASPPPPNATGTPAPAASPAAAPAAGATAQPAATQSPTAASQPPSDAGQPPTQAPTATAASTPEPAPAPTAPPAPKYREVTIPEGTSFSVRLATSVASDTSKVEDSVRGSLARPIVVSGTTVVPAGAEVIGSVVEANPSGRVKGRASIAVRFNRLRVREESHQIRTARIRREAAATKGKDAQKIGIGAGVGAIIGGVAGGGKGAAIGAAVGGGAGTGVVLATRGREVQLPAGTTVTTRLQSPMTVLVPIH